MEEELKVSREQRLKAMISIPIEGFDDCPNGAIAILNIDSAMVTCSLWRGRHNIGFAPAS